MQDRYAYMLYNEQYHGQHVDEQALIESGIAYTILRPTGLFGAEDILINNIAWMLRRFPMFGVLGAGQYKLQPIYVDDFASLALPRIRKWSPLLLNQYPFPF